MIYVVGILKLVAMLYTACECPHVANILLYKTWTVDWSGPETLSWPKEIGQDRISSTFPT